MGNISMKKLFFVLLFNLTIANIYSQNNLYKIGSLTGNKTGGNNFSLVTALGDINGDGYADFSVGSGVNCVKVYPGGPVFDTSRYIKFAGSTYDVAVAAYKIGDINKDGYDDFAISYTQPFHFSDIKIFLGKAIIDTTPNILLNDDFGIAAALGDVNGDGFDDFMAWSVYFPITAKGANVKVGGFAKLYLGGSSFDPSRCIIFTDANNYFLGKSISTIGDFNNDGYADFIIGYPESIFHGAIPINVNEAHIFYGKPNINAEPDVILTSGNDYDFGKEIQFAGKLDNSGKPEFILASEKYLYIYSDTNKFIKLNYSYFSCGGDLNNDGYNDFVISDPGYKNKDSVFAGAASIYYGAENIDTIPKNILTGTTQYEQFGYTSVFLGDINKDGFDELAIASAGSDNSAGKLTILSAKKIDGVNNLPPKAPVNFHLSQNYPNPFNPSTIIEYQIPTANKVSLKIYDMLGKEVITLVDGYKAAGKYQLTFNCSKFASGVYICKLESGSLSKPIKMIYSK